MSRAIAEAFVAFVTSSPAFRPARSTVIRSVTAKTSRSLWVMKMTTFP